MAELALFFGVVVVPSIALLAAALAGGYEVYRIRDYRLLVVVVVLGVMLQHQVVEWTEFWATGTVSEPVVGELFETAGNLLGSGGVYFLLVLLRRERNFRTERSRREREFESMVESAPTPMLYHCPEQVRLVNDAAVSMLDADDAEEVLGRSLTSFAVPEDRGTVATAIDPSDGDQRVENEQVTLETLDGDRREVVLSAEPFRLGDREGVQLTLNDVTERERSRAELERTRDRLQTLFDSTQDGILVVDPEEPRIVDANRSACEMLGYSRAELAGMHPEAIHPDETDRIHRFFESASRRGAALTDQLNCRRKDGRVVKAEVSAGKMRVDGQPRLLVSVRDVTGRRQRDRQLAVLHRLFRHNVRNRMNVVIGHAEALAADGEVDRDDAETIRSAGEQFLRTTEKMQRLASVLESGVEVDIETTDLSELVAQWVADYREREAATFETDVEPGVVIKGDRSIELAVENLLSNAVEHAGESPTVRVELTTEGGEPGMCRLVVADDGPGIPEPELVATDDSRSPLRHGSGLGLHAVSQTVDLYGGEFRLESAPEAGVGTRATISLSLASGRESDGIPAGTGERGSGPP